MNLNGKNILITGGSMGIGLATARACLKDGARVLICARNGDSVESAVRVLRGEGYHYILGRTADVTKQNELSDVLDELEAKLGFLNATIHAAGIFGSIGSITQVDPEEWFDGVRINLFGSFLVARESCLRFQKNGGGRMVLFSGGGASNPFPNYTSYACSKVAVVRFVETIAEEMASYNIEVNCLAPGFVVTRLHQQTLEANEKAGSSFLKKTVDEIAKGGVSPDVAASASAFLISDDAKGITGKFISAPYDSWIDFPQRIKELQETDIMTLRRIVPKDRGMEWQ